MITRVCTTASLKMSNRRRSQGRLIRLVVASAATTTCLLVIAASSSVIVDAFSTTPTTTTTITIARTSTLNTIVSSSAATTSRLFSTSTSTSPPPPPPPLLTTTKQQQQQQQQQGEENNDSKQTQPQQSSQPKSWTDDGFVFGLEGSGLARPGGRTSQIVVEGDSLETKPYQQVLVWTTLAAHAAWIAASFGNMLALQNDGNLFMTFIQAVILTLSSWILADFGSGVLHWSVDNYGNGRTPIMGSIIAAFQGHHSAPWTITERGFCNNVYKLCIPFGIVPMTLFLTLFFLLPFGNVGQPGHVTFFISIFCVFEILSQEFHKWSHQLKSEAPSWVNTLQDLGLTIARKPHAMHHLAPYEGNYCIISGICNPTLDKFGIFRRLEHFVYQCNGVEANAWKLDPELRAKTLAGDYSLPTAAAKSTTTTKTSSSKKVE